MSVRLATSADRELLVRCREDFFAAEGWELGAAELAAFRVQWREYFEAQLGRGLLAALVVGPQGDVRSLAFLVLTARPASPRAPSGWQGTVVNVLTYPEHRRRGYARRAIEALIEQARSRGVSRLELSASVEGEQLYRGLGFAEAATDGFLPMALPLFD